MAPLKQCMILSSKAEFDADELLSMIQDGGLNRLLLFGPRLSKLLGHARINTDALHALRNLRQIVYTGASPSADDETWMKEVGLPVTVSSESCSEPLDIFSTYFCSRSTPLQRLVRRKNPLPCISCTDYPYFISSLPCNRHRTSRNVPMHESHSWGPL